MRQSRQAGLFSSSSLLAYTDLSHLLVLIGNASAAMMLDSDVQCGVYTPVSVKWPVVIGRHFTYDKLMNTVSFSFKVSLFIQFIQS